MRVLRFITTNMSLSEEMHNNNCLVLFGHISICQGKLPGA